MLLVELVLPELLLLTGVPPAAAAGARRLPPTEEDEEEEEPKFDITPIQKSLMGAKKLSMVDEAGGGGSGGDDDVLAGMSSAIGAGEEAGVPSVIGCGASRCGTGWGNVSCEAGAEVGLKVVWFCSGGMCFMGGRKGRHCQPPNYRPGDSRAHAQS